MKYIIYQLISAISVLSLSLPGYCQKEKANSLDVNIGGNPNVNFNPINNNKYSTELRTFAPASMTPNQIELAPVSTPPVTGTVKNYGGAYINSDVVDPDISNAKEAEDLKRKTGKYFSKPIETVSDSQPIQQSDIQDFLKNYYHYLKDSELTSGSPPVVPSTSAIKKTPVIHKTSSLGNDMVKPPELLANQQKLIVSKTPSTINDQNPNSP